MQQKGAGWRTRPSGQSTLAAPTGSIGVVNLIRDTRDGWIMSADWPARRRRRFRIGLALYLVGLRQIAVLVAGGQRDYRQ